MNFGRAVSAQGAARLVYIGAGTAVFVLIARSLDRETLGLYAYATSTLAVATTASELGTTAILSREVVSHGAERPRYLANFTALRLLLGAAVAILLAGFALRFAPAPVVLPLLVVAPLFPLFAARFCDPVFAVCERPWWSLRLSLVYAVATLLGSLGAVLLSPDPLLPLVVAQAVAGALYCAVGLFLLARLVGLDWRAVRPRRVWAILSGAGPMAASTLFALLASRLDVFVIAAYRDPAELGLYNAAFRFYDLGMAVVITVVTPLVSAVALLDRDRPDEVPAGLRAVLGSAALAGLFLAVLCPTLSGLVLRLLFGAPFEAAAPLLDLLAWRLCLALVGLVLFSLIMALRPVGFVLWTSLATLAANAGLNLLLVPRLGATGAAWAGLGSEGLQAALFAAILLPGRPAAFLPSWWVRLGCLSAAAACLAQAPAGRLTPLLALPCALLFAAGVHLLGLLPANPLPLLRPRPS